MKCNFIKLLYLMIVSLSIGVNCMQQSVPWERLPIELKFHILSLMQEGKDMSQILENLKGVGNVSKEFAYLAKELLDNPQVVENVAKKYIQEDPAAAYNEFFEAVKSNNRGVVKVLITAGIDVNAKDDAGFTPLMYASLKGYEEIVKMLLSVRADVKPKDPFGRTALILGAYNKDNTNIIQMLIDAGADVNAKDVGGTTALMAAGPNLEIAQILIKAGVDMHTIIMWANSHGFVIRKT